MRYIILSLLATHLLFAEFKALDKTYDYFQAKIACEAVGKGWRLPEIWELFPLRGQSAKYGKDKRYWSANALGEARVVEMIRHENEYFVNSKDIPAFSFYLQDGDIGPTPKYIASYAICTNQKKIMPSDDGFTLEEEGVVDRRNKILWAPLTTNTIDLKEDYDKAVNHCDNSSLDNRDWRLPTLTELYSIVNYNYIKPSINKKIFGDMRHKYYLSNDKFDPATVYVVGFSLGSVATSNVENQSYFRCVSDLEEDE